MDNKKKDVKGVDTLNELHFDVLKEIGNIGCGNAISSLSALINKPVSMPVPEVKLLEFRDMADIVGGLEEIVYGILVAITGEIEGMMMFLLSLDSATAFVNNMLCKDYKDTSEFTEMETSAISEIGNILCSAYLGALSTLVNKRIMPSVPQLAKDMAGAILSVPAIEFGKIADKALFIDTVFMTEGIESSGYFLLVPSMESFNTILSSLGVL